ncbi:MAG: M20/M25/M40 family metallo-hydrolase, partial [Brevundimonas sp.]|nr:M20/M25/M40 family metallo-hydrolase [Brevundimonas sp.]
RRQDLPTANVIGLIEGSDPVLKAEYVVMTAHLDHLGIGGSGPDRINNGALDNAGGVAAMLEAARMLAQDPPRRSVLVVALSAEEMGLLGSDYLARFPVTDGVVANVNLDMPILTYDFTDVVAFGAEHSSMGPLVAAAAETEDVSLSPDPMPEQNVFTRSDHYSFVQAGIPSVMLATGYANGGEAAWGRFFADGYHKPNDDLSTPFNWSAAARFARVNAAIARAIADAERAPLWYEGNPYGDRFAPDAARAPAP